MADPKIRAKAKADPSYQGTFNYVSIRKDPFAHAERILKHGSPNSEQRRAYEDIVALHAGRLARRR